MIVIKCEQIPNKYVAFYLMKHQIPKERLRLIPEKKYFRLKGDVAYDIGKNSCLTCINNFLVTSYTSQEQYQGAVYFNFLMRGKNGKKFLCKESTGFETKVPAVVY